MRRLSLALAAAALALAACEVPREAEAYTTVPITPFLGEPVLGDKGAPVTITEYASTTCGHCKAFHDQVFPELKAKYIDTGKVKLVWAVMPTPPAAVSLAGAALARCAGEDRFFAVLDDLFDRQDALVEASRNPWQLQNRLREIGARHGLTPDQVGTCMDDKAIDAACSELSPLIRGIAREQLLSANAIASSIAFSADKKNVTVSADARNYRAPLDGSKVRVRVPTGDEMDLRYAVKTGRVDQLFEGDDRGRTNRYTLGDDDVLVMGVRVFASQLPKDVLYKLTYRRAS